MNEDDLTRAYAATDPQAAEMLLQALEEDRLLITPTNLLIQREVERNRAAEVAEENQQKTAFYAAVEALGRASPALLARQSIYRLAGRDRARRRRFEAQVESYHAALQEAFVPLLMRRATLDDVLLPEPFAFTE